MCPSEPQATWVVSADPEVAAAAAGIPRGRPATDVRAALAGDLVIVDHDRPPPGAGTAVTLARAQVLCYRGDPDALIALWSRYPAASLVGKRGRDTAADLVRAAAAARRGGQGIAGMLPEGSPVRVESVTTDADADAAIATVLALAQACGGYPDFAEGIATATMELVSNARRATNQSSVSLRLGMGAGLVAVSVTDDAGALTRATVLDNLNRCAAKGEGQIKDTAGSAGLGLYMVLQAASWLEFQVVPGRRTTVTFASRIHPTLKAFDAESRSVAFFQENAA